MRNHHVLADIIGKKIVGAVATESSRRPQNRLFLAFSDSTYLEFYGPLFKVAAGVDKGSLNDAKRYAGKQPETTIYVYEDGESPPTKLRIMADWGQCMYGLRAALPRPLQIIFRITLNWND